MTVAREDPAFGTEQETTARRWVVLVSIAASALIISVDNTVLSVAIPTVLHEFDTTLPSLQWVLTGYSLVFATLLVIGGRLGDLYGHRRMFALGGSLFAVGSLLAALSWSVPSLFVGEALIEGIGACLMLPSALAMVSTGFRGRHRAVAFSMLGAAVGLGAALGPLLGGFFTSELSWRLAFGINVFIAPCAVLGVLLFLPPSRRSSTRPQLDVAGALLIASGMFLLVFAISEGGTYGWWEPTQAFSVAGGTLWPESSPVSLVPVAFLGAAVLLAVFVVVERGKERAGRDPLFEFSELRHRGFRFGLVTTGVLAMGQLALILVLSIFLQGAAQLSALDVGLWLIPLAVAIMLGARLGAIVTNRYGAVTTVRCGLVLQVVGTIILIAQVTPGVEFWQLAIGLVVYGVGNGASGAQLVNVVLSDVDPAKSGVGSGTNTTVRQVGAALGIATVSSILTEQTIHHAAANIMASNVSARLQDHAIGLLDRFGTSFSPPAGTSHHDAATLIGALADGIADAARPALLFGLATMVTALVLSFLIPRRSVPRRPPSDDEPGIELLDALSAYEPVDPTGEIAIDPRTG